MKSIAIVSFQNNLNIIGAKYLHAFLRNKGIKSALIVQPQKEDIFKPILDFCKDYDVIGISHLSGEYYKARRFASQVDRELIVGGVHSTAAPGDWGGVKIFQGESELSLTQYLLGESVKAGPPEDLDTLPFPGLAPKGMYVVDNGQIKEIKKTMLKKYMRYSGKFPDIITTRGCPFRCSFCFGGSVNLKIRKRSVDNVITECFDILPYKPFAFNIQDENFLIHNNTWIQEFVYAWKKHIKIPFVIRAIPEYCTEEKIRLLKGAGLAIACIGMQTGSDKINREIFNRGSTVKRFLESTEIFSRYKTPMLIDIICENPWETDSDRQKTKQAISEIRGTYATLSYGLTLYQGTTLYGRAISEGLDFPDPRIADYHRSSGIYWKMKMLYVMLRGFKLIHQPKIIYASWQELRRKTK